jgi:hypothetical protein
MVSPNLSCDPGGGGNRRPKDRCRVGRPHWLACSGPLAAGSALAGALHSGRGRSGL